MNLNSERQRLWEDRRTGLHWKTERKLVQFVSRFWFFATPWSAAHQASLSFTKLQNPPNPCPLSWWCHLTISSSVVPFSSYPQYFTALGSLPMSQLFGSGGQHIGVSVSASVLLMNAQDWFPLGWTGWIALQSKELSRVFSNTTVQKDQFFGAQLFYSLTLNPYLTKGNTIALTRQNFVAKVMSLVCIFYF